MADHVVWHVEENLTLILLEVAFNCVVFFFSFNGQQGFTHVGTVTIGFVPSHTGRLLNDIIAAKSTNTLTPQTYFKMTNKIQTNEL